MILYKYASLEAGRAMLAKRTLGFSQAKYFNDPFDMPDYPEASEQTLAHEVFERLHLLIKNDVWAENTGILSLTRTPTNPLMWAHYGDKHRGMVIGIDMERAGLADEATNLVPAQFGSIIYVSNRALHPFLSKPKSGLEVGGTHAFPVEHYEKLQRLFLHKPIDWAYEEEVRVLKCVQHVSEANPANPSGQFSVVDVDGRPLYLFAVPSEAITEVYFGLRSDDELTDEIYAEARKMNSSIAAYQCALDNTRFTVEPRTYLTIPEHVGDTA